MLDAGFWMLDGGTWMSYRDLEIWKLARELTAAIHEMTITRLPKFEMFEEGCQIRRSIKSVKSNIVEGYGRRRYKQEFVRYLIYSLSSCDETTDHLETLFETHSLKEKETYTHLHDGLQTLGKKLNLFVQAVERGHMSEK
jgi:four helix bundle protein